MAVAGQCKQATRSTRSVPICKYWGLRIVRVHCFGVTGSNLGRMQACSLLELHSFSVIDFETE